MEKDKNPFQRLDIGLLFILSMLAACSIIAISSSETSLPEYMQNYNFAVKQIVWYVVGFIAIGITMIIDFDKFRFIAWYIYGIGMIFLLGLEFNFPASLIQERKGAVAWYELPGIGTFQPSELMKVIMIIVLAKIIHEHNEKRIEKSKTDDLLLLGKIFAASIPPLLLIAKQPDLGNTMVTCAIIAAMILVSGIRFRYILSLVGATVFAGCVMVYTYFYHTEFFTTHILKEYQLNRFFGWLAPYEYETQGYQLRTSLLAIGSGELSGKGYQGGTVYFPEPHTDFIFGVVAEEFGFIGACVVISLFFLLLYRMILIGIESNDPFGTYLCAGVIGMITFQVFQNVGMTIGVLPITGITLPFMSYGGSALATYMIAIGMVLNVRSRTKNYMF